MQEREGHLSEDGKSFIYDGPAPRPEGSWSLADVPQEFRGGLLAEAEGCLFSLLSGASDKEMLYYRPTEDPDGPVWYMYLTADSGVMTAPDSE